MLPDFPIPREYEGYRLTTLGMASKCSRGRVVTISKRHNRLKPLSINGDFAELMAVFGEIMQLFGGSSSAIVKGEGTAETWLLVRYSATFQGKNADTSIMISEAEGRQYLN